MGIGCGIGINPDLTLRSTSLIKMSEGGFIATVRVKRFIITFRAMVMANCKPTVPFSLREILKVIQCVARFRLCEEQVVVEEVLLFFEVLEEVEVSRDQNCFPYHRGICWVCLLLSFNLTNQRRSYEDALYCY